MKQVHKKMGWKKQAKMYKAALKVESDNKAKINGLLGVMIYIFGQDVMKAVVAFQDDPSEENKDLIRQQLELRFMETQDEEEADK